MRTAVLFVQLAAFAVLPAQAETVYVEVTGFVEYNLVWFPPLGDVVAGDPVTLYFEVDSDNFLNSTNFPTRGYYIDPASYAITLGPVTLDINPAANSPVFVLRDNDPAVDGFFTSEGNVDWPWPQIRTDEMGRLGYFAIPYEVGYTGDTLSSLDIIDAEGFYDYTGLTNYYWTVVDGWFDAMSIWWQTMTISRVPVEVPVDIKPGSCPNPFNARSNGTMPVAILGTADLDVSMIDPASVRLAGVAPLRSGYEDVGTPYEPYAGKMDCEYDCTEMESDGFMDLTLKFDSQELANAVDDTGCVAVPLTGNFRDEYGGGPITGEDIVRIYRPASTRPETDRVLQSNDRPADLTEQPLRPRS